MNNEFEDKEKDLPNGVFLNKLGDVRDFGNFYESIFYRKMKVLSFLNKDHSQFLNPDLRPFENLQHAYNIFLSYHIFYPYLYEDYMYLNTSETFELTEDINECIKELRSIANIGYNTKDEHGFACELLLFHEQRRLKRIYDNDITVEKPTVKKKVQLTKKSTVIRLKSTEALINPENNLRIANNKFIFKILDL